MYYKTCTFSSLSQTNCQSPANQAHNKKMDSEPTFTLELQLTSNKEAHQRQREKTVSQSICGGKNAV